MPNANTIIINKADKFGLTQLYQLRGRVGRGVNLAYAYFLYDGGKRLTPIAHKRLRTIYEATELGAGFHPQVTGRENAILNAVLLEPLPYQRSQVFKPSDSRMMTSL